MGAEMLARLEAEVDEIVESEEYAKAKRVAAARAAEEAAPYKGEWRETGPVWPKGVVPKLAERVRAGRLWQAEALRRLKLGSLRVAGKPRSRETLLGLAIRVEKDKAELARAEVELARVEAVLQEHVAQAAARAAAKAAGGGEFVGTDTDAFAQEKQADATKAVADARAGVHRLKKCVDGDPTIQINERRHPFHGTVSEKGWLTYGGSVKTCRYLSVFGFNPLLHSPKGKVWPRLCEDCFPLKAAVWDFRDGFCGSCTSDYTTDDAAVVAELKKGRS